LSGYRLTTHTECGGNIVLTYENRKVRSVETSLRSVGGIKRMMEGLNLTRYIVSIFVNVTMCLWHSNN
jgi:hypothetical protein